MSLEHTPKVCMQNMLFQSRAKLRKAETDLCAKRKYVPGLSAA